MLWGQWKREREESSVCVLGRSFFSGGSDSRRCCGFWDDLGLRGRWPFSPGLSWSSSHCLEGWMWVIEMNLAGGVVEKEERKRRSGGGQDR